MLTANELKNGTYFLFKNQPHRVLKFNHTHLGRGGGKIRVKVRNLKTGSILNLSFTPNDRFEEIWLDKRKLKFLKDIGRELLFYDESEEENLKIEKNLLGGDIKFLDPNQETTILFWEEEPLSLDLPPAVTLEIAECDPGVKGNSAANIYKSAVAKNGLELRVPLFVNVGDKVRVDTRTGGYLERA